MRLIAKDLTKRYRDADHELAVINRLSFEFPPSGTVAIVGRSGVGKSTLLQLLGGIDIATSGQVLFDDVDFARMNPDERAAFRAQRVGFVFQFHHLLPEFTAWENVAMPLWVSEVAPDAARDRALELLDRVGLKNRAEHRPGQLSGGEAQRVAVARAMVQKPRLILADEPTGNLDTETAAVVQRLIVDLAREQKTLAIVVTHSKELAAALDYSLEMSTGGSLRRLER